MTTADQIINSVSFGSRDAAHPEGGLRWRMNVGCSKSVLIEGLKRIEAAVLELDVVSKEGRSV